MCAVRYDSHDSRESVVTTRFDSRSPLGSAEAKPSSAKKPTHSQPRKKLVTFDLANLISSTYSAFFDRLTARLHKTESMWWFALLIKILWPLILVL